MKKIPSNAKEVLTAINNVRGINGLNTLYC